MVKLIKQPQDTVDYAQVFYSELDYTKGGDKNQMPSAYVLFNVSPGLENTVLEEVKETGAVEEAYISYGVYDVIVKATAPTMPELRELVTYRFRHLDNVTSTLTLMLETMPAAIREPSPQEKTVDKTPAEKRLEPLVMV
jgi:DNA-binding Lrp family transcriptional regulator